MAFLKMIIADDEYRIRNGLASLNWEKMGIEVKSAANGLEAYDLGCHFIPDILFTDIRMPGIDGLELINRLKEINSDMKCVILTGYKDFEYARTAIKLGVSEFILKPSSPREIYKVIQKCVDSILIEKNEQRYFQELESKTETDYIRSLLLRACSIRLQTPEYEFLSNIFQADYRGFCLLMFLLNKEIQIKNNVFREIISDAQIAAAVDQNQLITIAAMNTEFLERKKILSIAAHIQKMLQEYGCEALSVGVSDACGRMPELCQVAPHARQCVDVQFAKEEKKILFYDDICTEINVDDLVLPELRACIECVKNYDYMGVAAAIEKIKATYRMLFVEEKKIRYSCADLCISSRRMAEALTGKSDLSIGLEYGSLEQAKDLDELFDWVKKDIYKVMDQMTELKYDKNAISAAAMEIIEKEYSSKLHLSDVAERLFIHPDTLTRIMKKEKGTSFIKHLTMVRLREACRLLKGSDYSVQRISEEVGFDDVHYFGQLFRKYYNMTPTQYRKKYGTGEINEHE